MYNIFFLVDPYVRFSNSIKNVHIFYSHFVLPRAQLHKFISEYSNERERERAIETDTDKERERER